MAKVLVERPRIGSRHLHGKSGKGYKKRVLKEMTSEGGSPAHEGITRMYHGELKPFNEHLGPLRKFVNANVGRPWDKVYAEIAAHVDRGNVVQKHILTHLFQYVTVGVVLIDGVPYAKPHERWGRSGEPIRGRYCWYVCPKSGLLKRAAGENKRVRRARWQPQRKADPPTGWVDAERCVCRSADGRWLLVTVAKWLPVAEQPGPKRVVPHDVLLDDGDPTRLTRHYGKRVYAVAVRTLREAELKELPVTLPGKRTAPNVVR